jgi:hypothetical protein
MRLCAFCRNCVACSRVEPGYLKKPARKGVAVAAIASSAAYNNGYYGYYGDPAYAYGPGYAYAPGYAYDSYAYAPAPAYGYGYSYAPSYGYGYYGNNWSRQHSTNNFSIDSQR